MPGLTDTNEPAYISSHSADVILSDIRPFKLKPDALRCINVLLDEFLHNVLSASGSLSTDRLRASLLGLLPTSLGKEALLEAEVELRAYWERTAPGGITPSLEDDTATFHLPWAFELLRNKCEAYSTLNEADEDPAVEGRINEKYSQLGASSPKTLLVAPAALYLTAILEAVCEHILSNVGRVAARDSSRANATVNDLFTALCEDASVYGYFRTTKVYDQIEQLSKAPKSRRSKSFSRTDKNPSPPTSISAHQDPSAANHTRSGSVSRQSSDAGGGNAQRSSFDKARALRMFSNGKPPSPREDSQIGHRKSASVVSDGKNGSVYEYDVSSTEDATMLAEFDDLMRSASTVKMSLTPDRLKTMEVYKLEKAQRGNRGPTPLSFKPEPASDTPVAQAPVRTSSQRPSLRPVDSIIEDEEESPTMQQPSKANRSRQGSVTNTPSVSLTMNSVRTRSVSTSSAGVFNGSRKPIRSSATAVPSSFPAKASALAASASASNLNMVYKRDGPPKSTNNDGMPTRTRVKQRNRESLDLDEVMGGSDDEATVEQSELQPRQPTSPKRAPKVSSNTRELMDFLAEGPPDARPSGPMSREGKQLIDFLAEGPPNYGPSLTSQEPKPKTNRLQRMISKLNIGEKGKASDAPKTPINQSPRIPPGQLGRPVPPPNPLANRPIPPRPPRPPQPISPPSSPSQVSLVEQNSIKSPSRNASGSISQEHSSGGERNLPNSSPKIAPSPPPAIIQDIPAVKPTPHANGNGVPKSDYTNEHPASDTHASSPRPPSTIYRKPVPPVSTVLNAPPKPQPAKSSGPAISESDARDMRRLVASATTADECRLIIDMFLARAGISKPSETNVNETRTRESKTTEAEGPYPSPPPSMNRYPQGAISENTLENSVVDMLLGGSPAASVPPRPPRRQHPIPPPELPPNDASAAHETQDKPNNVPIATWNSPADFPGHATPPVVAV